jgi:integration host factor subunit alpha
MHPPDESDAELLLPQVAAVLGRVVEERRISSRRSEMRKDDAPSGSDTLPTLTKLDLTMILHERLGLNKREAKEMVEGFFDEIHAALVTGRDVKLATFGNFVIRRTPPRPGRNPRTGEVVSIGARSVVKFGISRMLKAAMAVDFETG